MKKLLALIAVIGILLPSFANAAVTVPWTATSTDPGYISPALVNGNASTIRIANNGTVGAPSIIVGSAGNTGLYSNGAGTLFFTNGTNGLSWNGNAFYPNTTNIRDLGIAGTNLWNHLFTNFASTTALTIGGLATPGGTFLAVDPLGNVISTTTPSGSGGISSVTGTYPVISSGGSTPVISLAFGTTTSNTWAGTQTFTNSPVLSTLGAGTVNSTAGGTLYNTATTSVSSGTGISLTGTAGALIGGTALTINNTGVTSNVAGSGISVSGATGAVTIGNLHTAGTGLTLTSNAFSVNTSQNIATLSNLTGNGLVKTSGGVGTLGTAANGTDYTLLTANACTNQVITALTAVGGSTCSTVANTMLANSTISGVSLGGTLAALTAGTTLTSGGTYTGALARTFDIDLTHANTWTGLQQFNGNASTTQLSVSGRSYLTGNVGIGTTTGADLLDIQGSFPNFKIFNTNTSQFAGAGFYLINQASTLGSEAGTSFYSGINDVAASKGFFAIDKTNSTGGGTGHILNFDYDTNTDTFYTNGAAALTLTPSLVTFGVASSTSISQTGIGYFGATATTTINADGLGSIKVPTTGSVTVGSLATGAGTFVAADPTGKLIATTSPSGGGGLTGSVAFSPGTFQWSVPAGVKKVRAIVQAGGGPGGYCHGNTTATNGGAAGGYAEGVFDVSATTSVQVIVGATSTSGITQSFGTNSSFGSFESAIGGQAGAMYNGGGSAGNDDNGAVGGLATGGTINVQGGDSYSGITLTGQWNGGFGGNSPLGGGGRQNSGDGRGFGSGGGGGSCGTGGTFTGTGGLGMPGSVLLEY